MPSIKDLKKSITSVKNTQQTTRAMKMVSAAKLRRAQEAIQNQRQFAKKLSGIILKTACFEGAENTSPLIVSSEKNVSFDGEEKKNLALVLVSSDRGLCGGFNANVAKATLKWISENKLKYNKISLFCVGKKAYELCKNNKTVSVKLLSEFGGKVQYQKAQNFSKELVDLFLSKEVDEVKFIYNEFINAITQVVNVENFLPLNPSSIKDESEASVDPGLYIYKPNRVELLNMLLKKHFSIQCFRILLESQASEHGARMSAMESATKNAGEMIKKLTLLYNKQRQAGITKELLEIISGSESQKT